MTPDRWIGSHFIGAVLLVISTSCSARGEAQPASQRAAADPAAHSAPVTGESCLGVADKGVFSDLDVRVQLKLPAKLEAARVTAVIDRKHSVLVLSIDGYPRKAYPLG